MLDKTTNTAQSASSTLSMRIRVEFAKTEPMRFTSHLDLYRAWERLLRRAELPLQFSQGYNPRPKLQLAAPLPLGIISRVEIIDFWISGGQLDLVEIESRLVKVSPPGIEIRAVFSVDLSAPPLQRRVSAAEYQIVLLDEVPQLEQKVDSLLMSESIIRQKKNKSYNLRPLILSLNVVNRDPQSLRTRLNAQEGNTGRPEEVLLALGVQPENTHIVRTKLILQD